MNAFIETRLGDITYFTCRVITDSGVDTTFIAPLNFALNPSQINATIIAEAKTALTNMGVTVVPADKFIVQGGVQ